MSDAERRLLERKAAAHGGDEAAEAKLERDMARRGETVFSFIESLIGKYIYIEGIRINYRGTLARVLRGGDGMPTGLVMTGVQRVSYFNKAAGPEDAYTFTHTKERLVPWDCVHDIGEEGFKKGDGVWK